MNDLNSFMTPAMLNFIFKIGILLIMGMYGIFAFVVYSHVRSLNQILIINKASGSPLLQRGALIYLLSTLSLFVAAVVIL